MIILWSFAISEPVSASPFHIPPSLPPSVQLPFFSAPSYLSRPPLSSDTTTPISTGGERRRGRGGRRHNRSLLSHFRIFPLPFFFPLTFSTNHPFFFSIFLFHFQQLPLPLPPFCTIPLSPPRRPRFLLSPLEPTLKWYGGGAGRRRHAMQPVCARGGGRGEMEGEKGRKAEVEQNEITTLGWRERESWSGKILAGKAGQWRHFVPQNQPAEMEPKGAL